MDDGAMSVCKGIDDDDDDDAVDSNDVINHTQPPVRRHIVCSDWNGPYGVGFLVRQVWRH